MLGIERTKTFIKDIKKAKFSEFLEILSKYTKAAWNILAAFVIFRLSSLFLYHGFGKGHPAGNPVFRGQAGEFDHFKARDPDEHVAGCIGQGQIIGIGFLA